MVHTGNIDLSTRGHADMHDLTKAVEDIVESSGGTLWSRHGIHPLGDQCHHNH